MVTYNTVFMEHSPNLMFPPGCIPPNMDGVRSAARSLQKSVFFVGVGKCIIYLRFLSDFFSCTHKGAKYVHSVSFWLRHPYLCSQKLLFAKKCFGAVMTWRIVLAHPLNLHRKTDSSYVMTTVEQKKAYCDTRRGL